MAERGSRRLDVGRREPDRPADPRPADPRPVGPRPAGGGAARGGAAGLSRLGSGRLGSGRLGAGRLAIGSLTVGGLTSGRRTGSAPRRARLDVPTEQRRTLRPHYDPDAFGRVSEQIARFLGTAKFLVYMTIFIALWIVVNITPLAFDPYTFTFLTLLLSLQASYAAPLILLAQNRQADRDRVSLEEDRLQNARLMAEVEYLSRELASLRQAVGEVTTRDFLREQLRELTEEVVGRSRTSAEEQQPGQPFDELKRLEREERKRRAERKRRVKQQQRGDEPAPAVASLGEPFAGEPSER